MTMKSVRESTKALVRSLGYTARTFASAEEFLGSNPEDTSCIILDVDMKGLSGIELQKRLIEEGWRTPIIFVTAFRRMSVYAATRSRPGRLAFWASHAARRN